MDVRIREHPSLDDALDLTAEIDRFAADALAEFRDVAPPPGLGERLLRRVLDSPEGLVLSAHLAGNGERIGWCVTGPFVDPLVGDTLPMVVGLFVQPEFRRRGLARALVRRARELLAERGRSSLAARAGHNDDALISMGERWGFVRAFEIMIHEG